MNDAPIRPRRSVLFMPGSNARALEKACSLDCDVVALDLEDAVAPEAKVAARAAVCAAVQARGFGAREVAVRINALSSLWGADDLAAISRAQPDAIILPKVSGAHDIAAARCDIPVWAMIETARGFQNLPAIAGSGTACLLLGSNDLLAEMQARPMPDRANLHAAMSGIVLAARAAGIGAIDGTYNAIGDEAGLAASCEQGRDFGFDGKTLIHPSQIEAANRAFTPDAAEIAQARRILAAFALPENAGKGAIALDGRMLERLHARDAARRIALADAAKT